MKSWSVLPVFVLACAVGRAGVLGDRVVTRIDPALGRARQGGVLRRVHHERQPRRREGVGGDERARLAERAEQRLSQPGALPSPVTAPAQPLRAFLV